MIFRSSLAFRKQNRQHHWALFQKSAQVCLNTIDRLDLSSPKRQFNVKLRQSRAPEGKGCRKGRPACLFRHNEKAKEALNKLSRTFLLASFRNRPPWHCLPGPGLRIFSMPFLVIYWLINSSSKNVIWVNLSQMKKIPPSLFPDT